jgi:hypothetical protein
VTSFFASSDTQTPPSIVSQTQDGERTRESRMLVSAVPRDTIAADPDDTFDYFQAQANAARERLWL